jgi:hypothetical protein
MFKKITMKKLRVGGGGRGWGERGWKRGKERGLEGLGRERGRGDTGFPPPLTKLQDSITVSKFENFLLIAKLPGQCAMCNVHCATLRNIFHVIFCPKASKFYSTCLNLQIYWPCQRW